MIASRTLQALAALDPEISGGGSSAGGFGPGDLERWTGGRWAGQPPGRIRGFSIDSRSIGAGQMFVALRTGRRDGHDYLDAALAAGAAAALVDAPRPASPIPQLVVKDPLAAFQAIAREHRRAFEGTVIGISGSAGKTSTKELLALLLGGPTEVLSSQGNLNNHLGVPLTLTRLDGSRHHHAVIEAGIGGPGEMEILAGMIEPDLALITLVAPAHLEGFGSVEAIARAKALLPAAVGPSGMAMFPAQCEKMSAFRELGVRRLVLERADAIRPSEPPRDRVYFTVSHRGDSTSIALAYGPPPPLTFTLRRVSDGMAQNAALALCAALWLGVPARAAQERLGRWKASPLRGEWREQGGRRTYLDCYNANPASMADSLEAFSSVAPESEPRAYVLGCMEELGADSARLHRELGATVPLRPQDLLLVVGDQAGEVRAGALGAGRAAAQVLSVDSAESAAARLSGFRGAVFVKGSRRWELERMLQAAS